MNAIRAVLSALFLGIAFFAVIVGLVFGAKGFQQDGLLNDDNIKMVGCIIVGLIFFKLGKSVTGKEPETKTRSGSGEDYEKACARSLYEKGYRNIQLTPVTGDFGADIIATDPRGRKVCFQCKYYSNNVGESAVQEVISAVHYYDADYGAVLTTAGFTPKAKELALRTGVILIENYNAQLDYIDRIEDVDAFLS